MHRRGVADDLRTANLLGALSLTLAERAGAAIAGGTEVAGTDAAALVTLHNYAEGEPLEVLRRALGLSQPGTVRLVDRLERRGLVVRGRGSDDARTVGARLTGAGRDAAVRILTARAEFL